MFSKSLTASGRSSGNFLRHRRAGRRCRARCSSRSLIQSGLSSSWNAERGRPPARRRTRARTSAPGCRSCAAPCGRGQQPRLARVVLLQPVERDVGDDVRVVARARPCAVAVDVELGVEVFALALVGDEVVEAGPRRVVVLAHVPLADVRRGVAGRLERPGMGRSRELGEVVRARRAVGVSPLRIDARLGEQSEVVQNAFVN